MMCGPTKTFEGKVSESGVSLQDSAFGTERTSLSAKVWNMKIDNSSTNNNNLTII